MGGMSTPRKASVRQRIGSHVRGAISHLAASRPSLFLPQPGETAPASIAMQVQVTVGGMPVKINARNSVHLRRFTAIDRGTKEPETVEWITKTLNENEVFVDVGANVGAYSVLAAIVAPGTEVLAFEPEPQSAAALCETVSLNNLPITVYPIALGRRIEIGHFHINGAVQAGLSDHQYGEAVSDKGGTFKPALTIGMMTMPFDYLRQTSAVKVPTHIKIDVDGREIDVLHGMKETLRTGGVRYVAVESVDPDKAREVSDFLFNLAFQRRDSFSSSIMHVFGR